MRRLYSLLAVALLSVSAFAQTPILTENFSSITNGDNTTTTGSTMAWTGNANFPTVTNAYQAGGAVKLGTSNLSGSITSIPLDLSPDGGNFKIEFDVKGWTTLEGAITVSVTGLASQTYSYTSVLASGYEHVSIDFAGGTANSKVTIATSAKRAFIDNVMINSIPATLAVANMKAKKSVLVKNTVVENSLFFGTKTNVQIVNANGQIIRSLSVENGSVLDASSLEKGFYIVTGVVNGQKVAQKIVKK